MHKETKNNGKYNKQKSEMHTLLIIFVIILIKKIHKVNDDSNFIIFK
jgi:hypothetical protein